MADLTAAERQLIGDIWTSSAPYDNLVELCDDIGNRWAGSASEHTAGEWLRDKLIASGSASICTRASASPSSSITAPAQAVPLRAG